MKRFLTAAASGTLAAGLASFLLPLDGVGFAPAAATKLDKTFEGTLEFSLDEMRMTLNGEEQENPMMDGENGASAAWTVVVTDTFESIEDGRPTNLLRHIEEISGSVESSDGDSEAGSMDELEGKTVRFAWNAEEGVYDVAFHESEGEEEVLALLTPDMDYRSLLPRGEVKKDDTWEIAGEDLLRVLIPGIDVRHAAQSGVEIEGEAIPEAVVEMLEEFLKGVSATCTYAGSSQVDGVEVGEIALKGSIAGTTEVDPRDLTDEDMDFEGEMQFTITVDLPVEGTLLWNLQGGHFHSFVLEGEGTIDMHMTMNIPSFGDIENEMSASLLLEQRASAERATE